MSEVPGTSMKKITILACILFMVSCTRKPDADDLLEIKTMSWFYSVGHRPGKGEYITFENNGYYDLTKDSIFKQKKFFGRIVQYNKLDKEITVKGPAGEVSVYYYHNYK